MNKTEFIAAVADKSGLSKVDAKKAVDASLEVIQKAMKKGEKVSFLGFGSFDVVERAARTGINPQTGDKIKIKARKVVKFKPGAGLDLTKKK